ncbi:putative peptide modification system cyclase [Stenotrophomonas sp. ISL-67]|uniref:putative peptide modification system cyclase n=1 Tax=Stenotrophomonas sp. ISL-67 TaxID=2819171 RepID=UPI001BEAB6B0|nr:putative peptide modification system cyclase [Stenotrophomonas sp. ISL-67]MBT2767696.1 putative peptide modification system cyclase [Stenotrophomonas sp. ISL-67]
MNGDTGTSTQAPQLRALLFTDLCDSLVLVERIGDGAAAELFQQHDRLVLALQQQWNGQLIDRSDGLFLLFERAIDGLGFALDYQRELQQLGRRCNVTLRARAGLHVGEVLIWDNSPEAIQAGSKSVEVEGLAKPMAARLMGLARPGQILLSSVAESLTRRASSELGERAAQLQWRSHGPWLFKGIPAAQEVFEVGEPGFAPLRMPKAHPKAQRKLPIWRRPVALAAELSLLAVLAIGGWMLLRPEPAIAFAERDWVVLADVDNASGEPLFDDGLQRALLLGLEQSRYVNVLSASKVKESRELLRVPAEHALDRELAGDVASREGARMVLAPSIRRARGQYVVAVDLMDPVTRAVVRTYHADAPSPGDVVAAVDDVVGRLRAGLGETVASVQQSVPLPQASTDNLQALKSFALAESAMGQRRFTEAAKLYEAALDADPDFAMAHMGLARLLVRVDQRAEALPHLQRALALNDRLPHRERLYLKAWSSGLRPDGWPLEDWRVLAEVYPDSFAGQANTAQYLLLDNRFAEAERYARAASVPQAPLRASTLGYLGWSQLGTNRYDEALRSFQLSEQLSGRVASDTRVDVLIAQRRYKEAQALMAQLPKARDELEAIMYQRVRVLLAADQDDCTGMADALASEDFPTESVDFRTHVLLMQGVVDTACERSNPAALTAVSDQLLPLLKDTANPNLSDRVLRMLSLAYLAQRQGDLARADALLREQGPLIAAQKSPVIDKWHTVVLAMQQLGRNQPAKAEALLRPILDGTEPVQARVVLRDAQRRLDNVEGFQNQNEWLFDHRGQAFTEPAAMQLMQPLSVRDTLADASLRPQ